MEAIYLSHSPEDGQFAGKLSRALENVGMPIVPRQDFTDTEMFSKCLDDALKHYNVLLLLWSRTARVNRFVERDWTSALVFDKKIVSIVLDNTAVPAALLKGQLVDFRKTSRSWQCLLKTLRRENLVHQHNGGGYDAQTGGVRNGASSVQLVDENTGQFSAATLHLRSREVSAMTIEHVEAMLKEWNFYDKTWQRRGHGISHQYETLQPFGDQIVIDHTTGLTWQRGGSDSWKHYTDANDYIAQLNKSYFGGFSDWRLPTLEEAMSLVEPDLLSSQMHISAIFSPEQRYIWTADKLCDEVVWFVAFPNGGVGSCRISNFNSVRAVRKNI